MNDCPTTPNEVKPISVVIPYYSNKDGLSVLLATLQAQIVLPHQIIVIDTSPDKQGFELVKKYQTTVPIICECAQTPIYESWNRGIELAGEDDVLIINDDVLLPLNTIDQLGYVASQVPALAYVPETPDRAHSARYVNTDFQWWAEPIENVDQLEAVAWMPGFAFMLTRKAIQEAGVFDTRFKVWFGDDDYQVRLHQAGQKLNLPAIVKLKNLYCYHYGGLSFEYQSKEVQDKITKDRKAYLTKYGQRQPEVKQETGKKRRKKGKK
jgi:GT2 family glycosyltransferase